jgi:hypothetical protein
MEKTLKQLQWVLKRIIRSTILHFVPSSNSRETLARSQIHCG